MKTCKIVINVFSKKTKKVFCNNCFFIVCLFVCFFFFLIYLLFLEEKTWKVKCVFGSL